ncbi:KH homology domain-containing protein 4-like [Clavelina lepadiformis]|uniref:KH homology domain-containing protein 4-like n=1 Tax=Clavelina lepadiformis TaxID=159417 RepID=UPI004042EA90
MSKQNSTFTNPNNSEIFRTPLPPPSSLSAANLIKSIRASKFSDQPQPTSTSSTNGSQPSSRQSKFSDAPPAQPQSKADAVAAAAAAAARINASLRAKGKLSDQTQSKPIVNANQASASPLSLIKISETKKVFSSYIAKIDINDLPLSSRTYFTQVSVQETLNKETGAAISTKGQFLTADEKKNLDGIEKQLHLFIQSPEKEKTELALSKLKDMISKQKMPVTALPIVAPSPTLPPIPKLIPGQPALPTGNFVQEKIFVGMDYCPPDFDLKSKLIGVNYANFNFVANATGAKVILRGRGSGFLEPTSGREAFESMYVFISHPNQNGVDAAKKLVHNLISTVHSEYNGFMAQKVGSGFGPQPTNNFSGPANFPSYPLNQQMPPNPYNNMSMPPTNPYIPSQYNAPPGANPYCPPVPAPVNPYGQISASNPYNTGSATSYNMPPPSVTAASHSNSPEVKPPAQSPTAMPPEQLKPLKRRRFKEEQPDDSNVLGYKQFSSKDNDEKNKRPRKNYDETLSNSKPPEKAEEHSSPNLPFWMSHD